MHGRDTPGEKAARDAMRKGMADDSEQVALVGGSRLLLRDDIREAVRDGIADALSDPRAAEQFWLKGFEVAQEQAASRAGLLVLGGLKKAIGIAAIVAAVYVLAGAPAAKVIWTALTKAG